MIGQRIYSDILTLFKIVDHLTIDFQELSERDSQTLYITTRVHFTQSVAYKVKQIDIEKERDSEG